MKRDFKTIRIWPVAILFLGALPGGQTASADPIADRVQRPINAQEQQFIERVIAEVRKQFPVPGEGWEIKESVHINQHSYRGVKGKSMIFESMNKVALPINIGLDFNVTTKKEKIDRTKTAQYAGNMGSLQEEMKKAFQSGNQDEIRRLSEKMSALGKGAYTDKMSPMVSPQAGKSKKEKKKKFYVQALINAGGEVIGKKYESSAPGAAKAFVINKSKTSYKYYFGPWEVKDRSGNWAIQFPKNMSTAANHARVVTLMVDISGDSEIIDDYVKTKVRTKSLAAILN